MLHFCLLLELGDAFPKLLIVVSMAFGAGALLWAGARRVGATFGHRRNGWVPWLTISTVEDLGASQ